MEAILKTLESIDSRLANWPAPRKSVGQLSDDDVLHFKDVPDYWPCFSARSIAAACGEPGGPRSCQRGHVSVREIKAFLIRREKAVRTNS